MISIRHLSTEELEGGLDNFRRAPNNNGILEMIVRRRNSNEREVLSEGKIDLLGVLSTIVNGVNTDKSKLYLL